MTSHRTFGHRPWIPVSLWCSRLHIVHCVSPLVVLVTKVDISEWRAMQKSRQIHATMATYLLSWIFSVQLKNKVNWIALMGTFSERYLIDNWHQLGTENHVKTEGLCKVTPIYHDNVDEFWHVVCRGHQIETQNLLKTWWFCIMTPIYHDNVSQFRHISACRAQK